MAAWLIGGERGSYLRDDGQIDQNAENAGAEEIPESHGYEKHHRSPMRKGAVSSLRVTLAELEERPGLDGEEGEWNDFRRRKERAQRHVLDGRSGKIKMMHRSRSPRPPSRG